VCSLVSCASTLQLQHANIQENTMNAKF